MKKLAEIEYEMREIWKLQEQVLFRMNAVTADVTRLLIEERKRGVRVVAAGVEVVQYALPGTESF